MGKVGWIISWLLGFKYEKVELMQLISLLIYTAEEASNKVNIMKQTKEEGDGFESKTKKVVSWSTPPPPPPHPKFRVYLKPRAEESVTKREIAKFWRQKRIEEEDHLLAAIKAAARLRARNLSVWSINKSNIYVKYTYI